MLKSYTSSYFSFIDHLVNFINRCVLFNLYLIVQKSLIKHLHT